MTDEINGKKVAEKHRVWNNSMYFYSDSATVMEEDGTFSSIDLGIDYFDGAYIECNKEAKAKWDELKRQRMEKIRKDAFDAEVKVWEKTYGADLAKKITGFLTELRTWRDREYQAKAIESILKVKNFRNEFGKSIKNQIVAWLNTAENERKFSFPLSSRQIDCICRYQR